MSTWKPWYVRSGIIVPLHTQYSCLSCSIELESGRPGRDYSDKTTKWSFTKLWFLTRRNMIDNLAPVEAFEINKYTWQLNCRTVTKQLWICVFHYKTTFTKLLYTFRFQVFFETLYTSRALLIHSFRCSIVLIICKH